MVRLGRVLLVFACAAQTAAMTLEAPTSEGQLTRLSIRMNIGELLLAAVKNGHVSRVERLISRGADVESCDDQGGFSLGWAAYKGEFRIAQALVQAGANVNHQDFLGFTSLMMAANYGNRRIAILLLDAGADVRMQNKFGLTALSYAIQKEFWSIARIIERAGKQQQPGSPPISESAWTSSDDLSQIQKVSSVDRGESDLDYEANDQSY